MRHTISVILLIVLIVFAPVAQAQLFPQPVKRHDLGFDYRQDLNLDTYSMGWWGGRSPLFGGALTADNIEKFYLRQGMRFVHSINVGWGSSANTPTSNIIFQQPSDRVMDLMDQYGMMFLIRHPLSGYGVDRGWKADVIARYGPSIETKNQDGLTSPSHIRTDHPGFADQLFDDLQQLWTMYGHHPSWVGFIQSDLHSDAPRWDGGGCSACGGLYQLTREWWGLDDATIKNFINSPYYNEHPEDSAFFDSQGNPIVSTIAVHTNIKAHHLENWRSYMRASMEVAWEDALRRFEVLTGKHWIFATRDEQLNNLDKLVRGNSPNGQNVDLAKILHLMRSTIENHLPSQQMASSLMFVGQQINGRIIGVVHPADELEIQLGLLMPYGGGQSISWVADTTSSCCGLASTDSIAYPVFIRYGAMLNRMQNVGTYYGLEDPGAPKVLWIQSSGISSAVSFMTHSLNITYADKDVSDNQLNRYGDLKQYDVIVLAKGGNSNQWSLSSVATAKISAAVQAGTGLVTLQFSPGGLSAVVDNQSPIASNHVIWEPYTEAQVRNGGYTKTISTGAHGSGRVVNIPSPYNRGIAGLGCACVDGNTKYAGTNRDSFAVLLNNAVFWAAKQGAKIPTYWHDEFRTGVFAQQMDEGAFYTILGSPAEDPLLWVFTDHQSSAVFNIHLRASAFGVSTAGWKAINVRTWEIIAEGTGEDIRIALDVEPNQWEPIYIIDRKSDLSAIYTNVKLTGTTGGGILSPQKATYTLQGPHSFSSWLIVRSTSEPTQISASNTGLLPEFDTLTQLERSIIGWDFNNGIWTDKTETGYFWDPNTQLAYIHFRQGSEVVITVDQGNNPAPPDPPNNGNGGGDPDDPPNGGDPPDGDGPGGLNIFQQIGAFFAWVSQGFVGAYNSIVNFFTNIF